MNEHVCEVPLEHDEPTWPCNECGATWRQVPFEHNVVPDTIRVRFEEDEQYAIWWRC